MTSSLLLVPTLLRQLPRSSKLAVLTADSSHCSEDLLGVDETGELARVVIGGIEGGKLLENEMKRPPIFTETADIEADVRARVSQLCAAHPDIGAILFECTAFPAVAPAIRGMTGLPVYDIATLCKMTFASVA
ncbi:MAG: hypothetical protein E5X89_19855 [Mesorhizobium sp.]|nr:MAG: hypothetical protein E5X89_19855 [Mesorhizobium sp.]TIQ02884.1 MAG: hypothetical protein E5X50_30335 [Mesorhizobium sp.]